MSRFGRVAPLILLLGATTILYRTGPPPAHTGGFGEPTCVACHFESPVNDPDGHLELSGFPDAFVPGQTYPLKITLHRKGIGRGGFQLSTRFAGGPDDGRQAGSVRWKSPGVTADTSRGVVYVRQSYSGGDPVAQDTARWILEWIAPDSASAPVLAHIAANAANGDDSEFGDFIYVLEEQSDAP